MLTLYGVSPDFGVSILVTTAIYHLIYPTRARVMIVTELLIDILNLLDTSNCNTGTLL